MAEGLARLPHVEVQGISCYPGHCRGDEATVHARILEADAVMRETRDAFEAAGISCARISGGSTPTRYMTHETCITELRSGTYALLDHNESEPEGGEDACALWVQVTVISDAAVPGQIVVDAGSKTLTSDSHDDGRHGVFIEAPGALLHTINEEHGYVDVSGGRRPAGDRRQAAHHPQPRVRLREPARRPARRARRRGRAGADRVRARARPLGAPLAAQLLRLVGQELAVELVAAGALAQPLLVDLDAQARRPRARPTPATSAIGTPPSTTSNSIICAVCWCPSTMLGSVSSTCCEAAAARPSSPCVCLQTCSPS